MPLLAIYNPVSGNGSAKSFFDEHVLPFLQRSGKLPDKVVGTEGPGDAGKILVEFLEAFTGDVTVILGSGDGTVHDIINILSSTELKGVRLGASPSRLHFVLIPCGTANALYSSVFPPTGDTTDAMYKLQSLHSFINGLRTIPLTLAITTLSSPPSERRRPKVAVSAVVTSTSLHASILHDSESLRKEMPGIERFKIAAESNSTKWYNSYVKLLPEDNSGVVQMYDPSTKTFVEHPESDVDDPIVDLSGPFSYFLSVVNVDRLEPAFRITPLVKDIPPSGTSLDVVVVRPLRDPTISEDTPDTRSAFVTKLWQVLGGAYKNGSHVDLRYSEGGEITSEGDGPVVVEYIRCGGWEWHPDDIDDSAHLLCSDGAIFHIEKGGRAVCSAATPSAMAGFMVHA